ncbi:MAG: PIN domain-containing protein [Ignavibacteria bacterium]
MSDRYFLDTNILIYYIGDEIQKQEIAKGLIYSTNGIIISMQIINEFTNVCFKKLNFNEIEITNLINLFKKRFDIKPVTLSTIYDAIDLKRVYKYSYYDSLMIASASEYSCDIVYSEDLTHRQIIENKIKILNPFI